jgi:hypothetical protein
MTADVTLPVDAERVLIEWLKPTVGSVPIDVRGGGSPGQAFVRVRRIGGVELTPHHDAPMFDVMCWHDSDAERMQLALQLWQRVRSANNDAAGDGVLLYRSTVLGPRQIVDPSDDTKSIAIFSCELVIHPVS